MNDKKRSYMYQLYEKKQEGFIKEYKEEESAANADENPTTATIVLEVVESSTVLTKVIQVIKRRRINIQSFIAQVGEPMSENAFIKIVVDADMEQCRLMKTQFEKIIDVVKASVV
jgi:acetolactate synthase regulatory subunit